MKVFLMLLIGVSCYALQSRKITATAAAPIPTAYSYTNTKSLVFSNLGTHKHVHVNNTTASAVACTLVAEATTTAPNPASPLVSEELFIPATTQYTFDDFVPSKQVYCRSDSGSTITSGDLLIHTW